MRGVGGWSDWRNTVKHSFPFWTPCGSEDSSVSFACLLFDVSAVWDARLPGLSCHTLYSSIPTLARITVRWSFSSSSSAICLFRGIQLCCTYFNRGCQALFYVTHPQKTATIHIENIKCCIIFEHVILLQCSQTESGLLTTSPQCTQVDKGYTVCSWAKSISKHR